jgi:hypothetical protein
MRLSGLITAIAISVCLYPCLARAQSELVQKPAKERGAPRARPAESTSSVGMSKQQRLSICIQSWDAQTHMTMREWRAACKRSLEDYPDAFR